MLSLISLVFLTIPLSCSPKPDDNWVGHLTGTVKGNYGKFEEFLKQGGTKYLACDTPTAPDFHLFEMIDQVRALSLFFGLFCCLAVAPKCSWFNRTLTTTHVYRLLCIGTARVPRHHNLKPVAARRLPAPDGVLRRVQGDPSDRCVHGRRPA